MTFTRTFDYEVVREIMTHPKLYEHGADDYSPAREEFQPREDAGIWYVRVDDAGELLGLFILAPQTAVVWEIHTRLLPATWGAIAQTAAREITPWVFSNIASCRRLVTSVPAHNRLAIRFAERAGMTRYGLNPASYLKRGRLADTVLLGIGPE